MNKPIAILATGEELIVGDTANSNGLTIAHRLNEHGLPIGNQLVVGDEEADIVQGLRFLLQDHCAVIVIGGLGPTTDDRTRFAVSAVIEQPLVFFEDCWETIVAHMTRLKRVVHPNNRQQALFPEHTRILPNPNGTAAGGAIRWQDRLIYLLPGPPLECLPLFEAEVLPELVKTCPPQPWQLHRWRLFNVSESEIATAIEECVQAYPGCRTGYRIDYPYLEVKLYTPTSMDSAPVLKALHPLLATHWLSHPQQRTSDLLKQRLTDYNGTLAINDQATGGHLQATLLTPLTYHTLHFDIDLCLKNPDFLIEIKGLEAFWQSRSDPTTLLYLTITTPQGKTTLQTALPNRKQRTLDYAVELIAHRITVLLEDT